MTGPQGFTNAWRPIRPRSARDTVLAEWRGIDLEPIEKALTIKARRLAQVLPAVEKRLNLGRRQIEAEVAKVWESLVDPNVAAHAKPTNLARATLFVSVDSSVWLEEIVRYRRPEILKRLQHAFGPTMIARLSFRVG